MPTTFKQIAAILNPPAPHMVGDGFRVHNFFPSGYKINMDPFYLLDYNAKIEFSARKHPRGVGVHPHRGFETVTIAYHGAVAHHDSAGNSGVINPGDIQWMTAASGILHKEYHEERYSQKGGPFQMVQLWVNLPAKYKMTAPKYQAIEHANIATFKLAEDSGVIEVIAGNYQSVKGSAFTYTPIELYNIRLKANGKAVLNTPEHYNTAMIVIEGSITINDTEKIDTNQMVHFNHTGTQIDIGSNEEAIVLFLSGAPINEPIAQYGPFLMNKPEELEQAIEDYNTGKFGYLEE
ncbi:pirin family protein [Pedobacter sp. ASV28]|uniref:pirin family protein n=1 Tax=Pedobacter sp. ASV28 TaxID=2795123 RepID=UPI0018EC2785|nr:pirin family protein [Pedobacter sp. ASV28]